MSGYCIKEGYQHGTANVTLEQEPGVYFTPSRIKAFRHNQVHPYYEAARLIREHQLRTVLDVGCGTGHKLIRYLEPLTERSAGVDQTSAIEIVRRLHPDCRSELLATDIEQSAETALGTFDLIVSVDVIEHFLDPDHLLAFIKSHCHDRTFVLISTPERDVRRGPDNMKPRKEHVREWNRAELKKYLESSGFHVVRQMLLPGFRVGWSAKFLRERLRLVRKRIPYRHTQLAVCKVRGA